MQLKSKYVKEGLELIMATDLVSPIRIAALAGMHAKTLYKILNEESVYTRLDTVKQIVEGVGWTVRVTGETVEFIKPESTGETKGNATSYDRKPAPPEEGLVIEMFRKLNDENKSMAKHFLETLWRAEKETESLEGEQLKKKRN